MDISEQLDEIEHKAQYSRILHETLGLDGSPVSIAITPAPPQGLAYLKRRLTPCMMIQMARRGSSFYCSGDRILCGGRAHLGTGKSPIWKLDDFLVREEKLFGSKSAARKLLDAAEIRAPQQGAYLAFSPLERTSYTPNVVLFIGTPAQISRIIFLNAFDSGEVEAIHGEPLCSGAIAAPITTAKIGVSFLDVSCRIIGRYKPEEMVVGVPYQRLPHIIHNISHSIAGTAKPARWLRLAGTMLRKRVTSSV